MAEDELKYESNESFSDQLIDMGEDVAAAGAAAATFYRMGGARFLSKKLRKYGKVVRQAAHDISALDYDHMDRNSLGQVFRRSMQGFKEARRKTEDQIDLDIRQGTAAEAIAQAIKLEKEGDLHARELNRYRREVTDKVHQLAHDSMKKHGDVHLAERDQKNIYSFIENAVKYAKDEKFRGSAQYKMDMRKYAVNPKLTYVFQEAIDNAIKLNTAYRKNQPRFREKDAMQHLQPVNDMISKMLTDVKKLNQLFGGNDRRTKVLDGLAGDYGVRVKDLLDDYAKEPQKRKFTGGKVQYTDQDGNRKSFDFIQELHDLAQHMSESDRKLFMNVRLDPYLRTNGRGEFYSFTEFANIKHKAMRAMSNTLPGKLLKLGDFSLAEEVPAFFKTQRGSLDLALAAFERKQGAKNDGEHVLHDYYRILDTTYQYDYAANKLRALDEIDPSAKRLAHAKVISGDFGSQLRLYRAIGGLDAQRELDPNSIWSLLHLNGSPDTGLIETVKGFFQRDSKYFRNIVEDIRTGEAQKGDILDRYDNLLHINTFLEEHSQGFNRAQLAAFNTFPVRSFLQNSGNANEILSILVDSHSEKDLTQKLIAYVSASGRGDKAFENERLNRLVADIWDDQWTAHNAIKLDADTTYAFHSGSNVALDQEENLRKELSREFVLQAVGGFANHFDEAKALLERTGLRGPELHKAELFAYSSIIDYETAGIFTGGGIRALGNVTATESERAAINEAGDMTDNIADLSSKKLAAAVNAYENFLGRKTTSEGIQEARKVIDDTLADATLPSALHVAARDTSLDKKSEYIQNHFVYMSDSVGIFDLLGSINEGIKENSLDKPKDTFISFFKQFTAGRKNMDEVTFATMVPYFFLHRLGADDLPAFLQWTSKDTSSSAALMKGVMLRLAPIAIGATELEWADDTVGAITGTRPSAGFVNAMDYMDIGIRQGLDATGIGSFLNTQSYVNPIMQYWGGKDGYYDADQERDYYANGYEAVRSGRYWSFGSVNEFRGGTVQYFQPNLTRRLNSDYYNKSLYNGYFDKWGHSLLPTPLMPFSPLIYALDPYYLENEHYNDRPYLTTGTMFEEDTPWGIVLNPTVGELIKPVRRMHEDRMYDGKDVEAIIYDINQHIRSTADGNHAYTMMFDREQIYAGEYTGYSSPAMGEYNIKVGKEDAATTNARAASGGTLDTERRTQLFDSSVLGAGSDGGGGGIGFGIGGDGSGGGSGGGPLNMLGQTNRRIKEVATLQGERGGILTTDRIRYDKIDDILNKEDMNDLITASTGMDLVHQMSDSFRLISGIYGYGANRLFGFGDSHQKHIADASDMYSFSRSFWDEAIGGLGGGAAEIGRRFIPEFRRSDRINPLLNTMPDWLPSNLRLGDPYAAIPKGEARLPGKGYEALNHLHPDEYGIYGAFDRYKILADVAPNSAEFKVWKKIAQQTVTSPQLQKQMDAIQDRVNEMNKAHDFYNYNVVGQDVEYKDVTITKVNNDGTFNIYGSDELYKIAGVDVSKRAQNASANTRDILSEYLVPGKEVTIATDANVYHKHNSDAANTVNAAVFVDGESLAQNLLDEHKDVFERRKDGTNAADVWATTSGAHRALGWVAEVVAHSDLPWLHDKFLRVRSPLESYRAEQVYGTPYQTWSEMLGTFLFPALERSVSDPFDVIKSTAEFVAISNLKNRDGIGRIGKWGLSGLSAFMDRGAFIGGTIGTILKSNDGRWFERGTKIGAAATLIGNLYTSTQTSTVAAAASWAQAGWMVADVLDDQKKLYAGVEDVVEKFMRNNRSLSFRVGAAISGAIIGAGLRGAFGKSVLGDNGDWKPERVQKKWELEDYFDRLNYIKYMGLYHKAAREAKDKEGIDIEQIFQDQERWKEKRQEIMEDSDVNNTSLWQTIRRTAIRDFNSIKQELFPEPETQNHRFVFPNGMSINDLPGVRNGIFHSDEVSEEDRLYTLNALVSLGARYQKPGNDRTQDDRDMTQLTKFEQTYGVKIPKGYQVHHIVEFSSGGADDPSNMIALTPDDHRYITDMQNEAGRGAFEAAQIGARTAMRVGEYGRAAILYKKAAESTMYGLKADARWTDVVKALPRYERDYFTEFMKEKDPDKQKEILATVSPFLRRALKQVWGMDYEEDKGPSNGEYFQGHYLPNFLWEGWKPDSDMNKIKAKTIRNEGMQFSDFGIYESQYRDQDVINAPNISPSGGTANPISVQASLAASMRGIGLTGVEVSVEPKSTKGIQSVINLTNVMQYKFKNTVNDMFSI